MNSARCFACRRIRLQPRKLPVSFRVARSFSSDASTSSGADQDSTVPSQRQLFRDIPVNPSVLNYIRMIGVGIPPRQGRRTRGRLPLPLNPRKSRGGGTTKRRTTSSQDKDVSSSSSSSSPPPSSRPPPPFGPDSLPVVVTGRVQSLSRDKFPQNKGQTPEVALAGRSNVGKSTLLNALLYGNRSFDLAKNKRKKGVTPETVKLPKGVKASMSDQPGETSSITWYKLHSIWMDPEGDKTDHELQLVDLPGYGFAHANEARKIKFRRLIAAYLLDRGSLLKRILLLVDARHGLKKTDIDFLDGLQDQLQHEADADTDTASGTKQPRRRPPELPPIQMVLTKCDLVSQSDLARRVIQVRQQLSEALRREPSRLPVMLVSARAGVGYNNWKGGRAAGGVLELQKELAALVVPKRRQGAARKDKNVEIPWRYTVRKKKTAQR